MNYDDIRSLLIGRLATVIGLPTLQTENSRVKPSNGTPWCRSTLLTAEPNALTLGVAGSNEHQGLFQVDLFYPTGQGTAAADAMSSLVQNALQRGTSLTDGTTTVQVRMVWQDTSFTLPGDAWFSVPVKVRWVAYRTG